MTHLLFTRPWCNTNDIFRFFHMVNYATTNCIETKIFWCCLLKTFDKVDSMPFFRVTNFLMKSIVWITSSYISFKEIQIILFLVIVMYCQANSSQFNQSLNLPPVLAGWEGTDFVCSNRWQTKDVFKTCMGTSLWQTRNNLSIIWISLVSREKASFYVRHNIRA